MERESLEEISGHLSNLDDPVRVVLEQRDYSLSDLLASPVGVRYGEYSDHQDDDDDRDRSEKSDQALSHQKASPIERWRVSLSRTPRNPPVIGLKCRRSTSVTRRVFPSITSSVT